MRTTTPRALAVACSLAAAGTLLLAACGTSTTAATPTASAPSAAAPSAAAGAWNPPRPTGMTDAMWADYSKDPAGLSPARLAAGCASVARPTPAEIDQGLLQQAPGSTPEQWNAYYDFVLAYAAPLCAALPATAPVKGLGSKRTTYG